MISKAIIKHYLAFGRKLTPLKSTTGKEAKRAFNDWTTKKYADSYLLEWDYNIAWVLSASDVVIDVDVRHGGLETLKKLKVDYPDLNIEPHIVTASGGHHYYFRISSTTPKKIRTRLKEYPGIEFLSKGSHVNIAGCKVDENEYIFGDSEDTNNHVFPETLLDKLEYRVKDGNTNDNFTDSNFYKRHQVEEMLNVLDPSMPNNEWVSIGMALHNWNCVEGLEVWEEWSKKGDNYTEYETEKRWRSFDEVGTYGVSLGTLVYKSNEEIVRDNINKSVDLEEAIRTAATEQELMFDVLGKIVKANLDDITIEKLCVRLKESYKHLTGVTLSIKSIRDLIKKNSLETPEKPAWCYDWVYDLATNNFFNLNKVQHYSNEAFNLANGKFIPRTGISKISASKYVADYGFIEEIDGCIYLPNCNDKTFTREGKTYINTYNPSSMPQPAEYISNDAWKAISMIEQHLRFLCGDLIYTNVLLQWLAWQIQKPGELIRWSPIIQGIEGIGKSFIGVLLETCLGKENVGTVKPSELVSDYNSWAYGSCVNILAEMVIPGKNRYDAANSLKPLITDETIQINKKHVPQFNVDNVTNYICFTNRKDSVPVTTTDRRWFVIFAPIQDLEDFESFTGIEYTEYFELLFNNLHTYKGAILKWLKDYDIKREFKSMKVAPRTVYKDCMIATELDKFEGLTEADEILTSRIDYLGVSPFVVSSPHLFKHVEKSLGRTLGGMSRTKILKHLGFVKYPKKIIWDSGNLRGENIWVKGEIPVGSKSEHDIRVECPEVLLAEYLSLKADVKNINEYKKR